MRIAITISSSMSVKPRRERTLWACTREAGAGNRRRENVVMGLALYRRQRECESGSPFRHVLCLDLAAVGLDDGSGDRQSQPQPLPLLRQAGSGRFGAKETIE